LKFYSGEFNIANGLVTGGKFIIDMNTLTNTDLKDAESNAKLVNHLKSADFFDVAKHNTATFVINRAEDSGNGSCLLYGDLTVKGITKPRMAEVILTQRDNTVMIAGILTFDRSEYDVRYGSGKFFDNLGDELIKDEIDLRIKVFAKAPENV
jgi:polyisoprenoid-binding protein YceI